MRSPEVSAGGDMLHATLPAAATAGKQTELLYIDSLCEFQLPMSVERDTNRTDKEISSIVRGSKLFPGWIKAY